MVMHELPATPWPSPGFVAPPTDNPVRFLGTGSEYFRIWIVNLLLTIVTLGIYSAWAKVRRLKYMYRNTQIADSSFDYHGSAIAILKGRLVALVLLIAYNFSFQLSLIAGVVTLAFLAAIFPWLIRQSLRFRARYSSYRGIHFQFVGGLAEIYLIAAPLIFLVVPFALLGFYAEDKAEPPVWLTALLGLATFIYLVLLPYLHYRFKRYQHGNTFLGPRWRASPRPLETFTPSMESCLQCPSSSVSSSAWSFLRRVPESSVRALTQASLASACLCCSLRFTLPTFSCLPPL